MKILIVDDDPGVRNALDRALRFEGYEVLQASDGQAALDLVPQGPDAIVLDRMMPGMDGIEVCRRLRSVGNDVPILILTARHTVGDRVEGLDAGADDYLVKPFALEEMLARLRAMLRRQIDVDDDGDELSVAGLTLNPGTRQVTSNGKPVDLTRTEFNLLELLMRNAGQVLTRDLIFERVWGFDFETTSNSLDVYIGYLRRKTEAEGAQRVIETVRGVGYVIRKS